MCPYDPMCLCGKIQIGILPKFGNEAVSILDETLLLREELVLNHLYCILSKFHFVPAQEYIADSVQKL